MPGFRFVDCHSHVVPSGDDGAASVEDGVGLCRKAASRSTGLLFATPHVWPHLPLTPGREAATRSAFERVREAAGLELRLGFELTPSEALLEEDLQRYVLEGTDCVLMEVPFMGGAELLFALAERVERARLRPVIAHPERTEAVLDDPEIAEELAARGWLLQVNATSVTGDHGPSAAELAWQLIEGGHVALVASDGHRPSRPPHLDAAFAAVRARVGGDRAKPLFDGSALGLSSRPLEVAV